MDSLRPLMLGIVGDSAAGKTTLVRGVARLLGGQGVTPVCLDDYHRYDRAERAARGLTASDPAANNLDLMTEQLEALRAGGTISKPVYDHRSGVIRGPELVAATGLVIAYGLLTLAPPIRADLFDLTVFLDPAADLRQLWRLARDVAVRGYTAAEVHARQPARERDAARYIQVQRPLTNLVLRFRPAPAAPADLAADLWVRRGPATAPLAPLLDLAAGGLPGCLVDRDAGDPDGRQSDILSLAAPLPPATAAALQGWLWRQMPARDQALAAQIGLADDRGTRSESLALVQLLIAFLLLNRGR